MHSGAPCMIAVQSARANQALLTVGCDRRKRRSGNPKDLRSVRTSQYQAYNIVELRQSLRTALCFQKQAIPAHSKAGTIARLMELASTPEIWMTKGFAGISNFTLFRIPSQSLTPLDVTDLRNCPSCTTSIQPAADRLMVYLPGASAFLNAANPEKVFAAGMRSGIVGRLASAAGRKLMIAATG